MNFCVPERAYASAAAYGMATEAQAHIDEEMRKLSSLRNTFSPTCRFPSEILAIIFIHCATDHHNHDHCPNDILLPLNDPSRDVPNWVNVSYVCRHWRNVALDCPALWGHHFVASLRWTEELLARSKQAPLKICLRLSCDEANWWMGAVEKLMKHAERFEDVNLSVADRHASQLLSILSQPLRGPCLENLTISIFFSPSEQPSLPFHGDTPVLCMLDLSYCPVSWRSFNLGSLMILHLVHFPSQFLENTEDILAILPDMRCLTELCLYGILASAVGFLSSLAFHSFQNANLPRLSRLSIHAPLSAVLTFLFCVNLPLKLTVQLICSHEDDTTPKCYTLLSLALTQRLSMFQDQSKIRSLIINLLEGHHAEVMFSSLELDCDGFQYSMTQDLYWNHNIPFLMSFCWNVSIEHAEHFISNILCSMPLMNVQTLHINSPPYSLAFWKGMLGHLQDLWYIGLDVGQMPDLASVLSVTDPVICEDVENQDQVQAVLVPQLEELELSHCCFSPEGGSDLLEPAITLHQLFGALSTHNAPHGRLNMLNCKVGGSGDLPDMMWSWDDLTNIPVVLASESDSYEESGSESGWEDMVAT